MHIGRREVPESPMGPLVIVKMDVVPNLLPGRKLIRITPYDIRFFLLYCLPKNLSVTALSVGLLTLAKLICAPRRVKNSFVTQEV